MFNCITTVLFIIVNVKEEQVYFSILRQTQFGPLYKDILWGIRLTNVVRRYIFINETQKS